MSVTTHKKKIVRIIGWVRHGRLTMYWQTSNGRIYAKSIPLRKMKR